MKTSFGQKNLQGRDSSSFYFKFGTCKTRDSKEQCETKGYEYIDSVCYRPRYHYVDNRSSFGNAPSVAKEMLDLNPINLASVLLKKTNMLGKVNPVYGHYEIEPCEEEDAEHFIFGEQQVNDKAQIFFDVFFLTFLVITVVICGAFLYLYYKGEDIMG